MEIKKVLANVLLNTSMKIAKSGSASYCIYGVEEMPESMKKER